jgi:aldehyde dehydrogenase (NAD+)
MSTVTPLSAHPNAPHPELMPVFRRHQASALRLRQSTLAERKARITQVRDLVMNHRQEIIDAARRDCGKPAAEVELTEIFPVVAEANEALRHLKGWMRPQRVRATMTTLGTRGEIRYEPRGTTLIVSPWNYPVTLSLRPLISALAAGCTVILKPSEMTPNLSALLKRLLETTFPIDEVAVFEGDAQMSTQLLDLPFDHIFFTGSPRIGKVVMSAAAKHLTSVTLELGGKSPVIVDRDADLDKTARNIIWGKTTNCGQTCIAPDYVYVHEDIADALIAKMGAAIKTALGQTPANWKDNPDYSRIVNAAHHGRVSALLQDALDKGARVAAGGETAPEQNYLSPTLLTDVSNDAAIMHEEIFGPLLPIRRFRDLSEPIGWINANPKPLALYIFGRDRTRIESIIRSTSAGGTVVNHVILHFLHANLPFGGVNNSGIGSSHGFFGFQAFSHARAVLVERFSSTHLLFPPYTNLVRRLIRFTTRWLS